MLLRLGHRHRAEAVLVRDQKEIEAEKKRLAEELVTTEQNLSQATATRDGLVRDIEPRLFDLFQQLAKVRKGVALCSATRDGLCSVCHVRLRPPVFQKVRHNDSIVQCEVCQRILYYAPPPPPVEATVAPTS